MTPFNICEVREYFHWGGRAFLVEVNRITYEDKSSNKSYFRENRLTEKSYLTEGRKGISTSNIRT